MQNIWIKLAQIASQLDRAGLWRAADAVTRSIEKQVITRQIKAQLNGPSNFYPNPSLQQGIPFSEGESEFEDRDDSRNNDARYQSGGDGLISPGSAPDQSDTDANGNPEPHSPMEMNSDGGDPGEQIMSDSMSPSQMGGTEEFTWENTRGKNDNPADRYKNILPH